MQASTTLSLRRLRSACIDSSQLDVQNHCRIEQLFKTLDNFSTQEAHCLRLCLQFFGVFGHF